MKEINRRSACEKLFAEDVILQGFSVHFDQIILDMWSCKATWSYLIRLLDLGWCTLIRLPFPITSRDGLAAEHISWRMATFIFLAFCNFAHLQIWQHSIFCKMSHNVRHERPLHQANFTKSWLDTSKAKLTQIELSIFCFSSFLLFRCTSISWFEVVSEWVRDVFQIFSDLMWCDVIWYNVMWCEMMWCDVMCFQ